MSAAETINTAPPVAALPEPPPAVLEGIRWAAEELGASQARTIAVASADRAEGRTSVALALARVEADDYHRRTLLLDLDLGSSGLTAALGLAGRPGVAELARGEVELPATVHPVAERVWAIPAGSAGGAATWLLRRFAETGTLAALLEQVDVIVGDLPPVLAAQAGRSALAAGFDAAFLVVAAGSTRASRARQAAGALPVEPVVVLNRISTRIPRWLRRVTGAA